MCPEKLFFWEVIMRAACIAIGILMCAGVVVAAVGGGDLVMKNEGGDSTFSHETHVDGAGLKCSECHPKLFINTRQHKPVTMEMMEQGQSCGACHNDKTAFTVKENCDRCHQQ